MEQIYDAIIIGSGAAGMQAALDLAKLKKQVLLITKTPCLAGGSTFYAQGGMAAAMDEKDSAKSHEEDTLFAGAGLVDKQAAKLLTTKGKDVVEALVDLDMPFDRDKEGEISLGREAAHTHNRIVHAGGDATGKNLSQTLAKAVLKSLNITCLFENFVTNILTDQNGVIGVQACDKNKKVISIKAPHVILATGGIGQLFTHTTNPETATADGVSLAYKAGARLADIEFVQFHPTALNVETYGAPKPLLTEALRGAGAVILDDEGHRFMKDEHELLELAPRDVVARAIWKRLNAGRQVFLDTRHVEMDAFKAKFPTVLSLCLEHDLDPTQDLLPIAPAVHYHMGGVETDLDGRTNIKGLWAIGEVARTGVHGANRLASNSLLECLVFATQTAKAIMKDKRDVKGINLLKGIFVPFVETTQYTPLKEMVQNAVYQGLGLIRNEEGMMKLSVELEQFKNFYAQGYHDANNIFDHLEYQNLILVARLIAKQALIREESRGGHYRSDYPKTRDDFKKTFACEKQIMIIRKEDQTHEPISL